jgi:hypothetical protein
MRCRFTLSPERQGTSTSHQIRFREREGGLRFPGRVRAPLAELAPEAFADTSGFFRMGHAPVMIEILMAIKGVDFDRAWERRIETVVDINLGQTAFMISREDLIAAKLAGGRPQDLADVAAIRDAEDNQER